MARGNTGPKVSGHGDVHPRHQFPRTERRGQRVGAFFQAGAQRWGAGTGAPLALANPFPQELVSASSPGAPSPLSPPRPRSRPSSRP